MIDTAQIIPAYKNHFSVEFLNKINYKFIFIQRNQKTAGAFDEFVVCSFQFVVFSCWLPRFGRDCQLLIASCPALGGVATCKLPVFFDYYIQINFYIILSSGN